MQEGVIKAGRSGHEASFSITGARLVDPWVKLDMQADLHVADGRIIAVGAAPHGFRPARTIDGTGLVVSPGLVDLPPACASRASNTRPRWNPRCRPPWLAA